MQKKINKNTYTKQKNIYKNTKIYCPQEKSQNQNTKNNTNTDSYIHIRYKKVYTTYKIYQTEKYTPKKSNTHKKIALITKKYTTRTMPNTVIYANTCNTHNLKEESKQN